MSGNHEFTRMRNDSAGASPSRSTFSRRSTLVAVVASVIFGTTQPICTLNPSEQIGMFERNLRPSIVVVEDSDAIFQDVLINVKETRTGSLMFGAGVNSDAGLVGSVTDNSAGWTMPRPRFAENSTPIAPLAEIH